MDFCFGSKDREVDAHLPTLDIILSMKPPLIEQVLEYFVEEVEKKMSVDIELGQWLYSLLSVVELPLDPDICSCLRALARACSKIRANLVRENDGIIFFLSRNYIINFLNIIL